ncbi:hypothetical protein E7X19_26600, partial [Bacteroides fragilis]
HDHIGYNYRMPNINAALGCAQMENLDRYVSNKRRVGQVCQTFDNPSQSSAPLGLCS